MKKTFYIIALGLLGLVGFTRADVNSMNVTPVTQSAISGSLVTFTVTGTNGTGDMYLKYTLPKTSVYDVMYQNANLTPLNLALISIGIEHDPVFFIPANSNFSVTITAKATSTVRTLPTMNSTAIAGDDMYFSTILTSAVAQITPISDLIITNVLTGMNPSFSGDIVSYYITLQNIGSTSATGISFISNFPISTLAVPFATFDMTPYTYNYITYPQDFVWTGGYLNNLNAGQTMVIVLTSNMTQSFAVGTPFNQIAKITATSAEYTTGNNSATATGIVQSSADVRVTKTLAPFTGYNVGDQVIYTITYGNIGGKSAANVMVTDSMSGQITLPLVSFAIGTLPAGSGGTITLTGTLTNVLSSGYVFVNTANISTTSIEGITGNNTSIATGTIQGIANVAVNIIANNISNPALDNAPYGSGSAVLIQAVSGDIVQLTITYTNFGNVLGTNAAIAISGTQGFASLGTYNGNIGTLLLNTTGTLVVTGIVGPKNYISFAPTARLTYNSGLLLTDNVTIQEPLVCGDGLLTRTEPCDTQGNLGVLYSGQVCQNQQNMCVLVTQSIINNACINYQYTNPLGGTTTGQSCSSVNTALNNASCAAMSGSAPVQTNSGYSINFTCNANNALATTPITIDCGNGTSVSGIGTTFNGTCNYASGFVGASAQCKVGNDINNSLCRVPVAANQLQCDLEALDGRIVIMQNNQGEGRFRCETRDNATAQNISINCGTGGIANNGSQTISSTNSSSIETVCTYTNSTTPRNNSVTCSTNSLVCETENIILDEPFLGYCGNGIQEGYEECDGTDTLAGESCDSDCTFTNEKNKVGCFGVSNKNISIQEGEIFPFQFTLDRKGIIPGTDCDANTVYTQGQIPEDSIQCDFSVQNSRGDEVYRFTKSPCKTDNRNGAIFDYIKKDIQTYPSSTTMYGRDYLTNFLGSSSINAAKFDNYQTDFGSTNYYGEYKLVLNKVRYNYCDSNANTQEGAELNRVCETNFTVTKPYLIQKSSFGLTPKATTDIDIKDFYAFKNPSNLISSTQLDQIMLINADEYNGGSAVTTLASSFVTKYEKIAVKYKTINTDGGTATVYKVPGQDIMIFKGNGTLVYGDGGTKMDPFTVIIDGPNLTLSGSITKTNGMFLVTKGTIKFLSSPATCNDKEGQIVQGIFVAKEGSFVAGPTLTNNDTTKGWCAYGGLHVKGILIGAGIENLVKSRRSQLNDWFYTVSQSPTAINSERRNEIFKGAAVLIEYSPSLWSALPPGASEFTKALDVYKQ